MPDPLSVEAVHEIFTPLVTCAAAAFPGAVGALLSTEMVALPVPLIGWLGSRLSPSRAVSVTDPDALIADTVIVADPDCPAASVTDVGVTVLVPPTVLATVNWNGVAAQPDPSRFVTCPVKDAVLPAFTQILDGLIVTEGVCPIHTKDTLMTVAVGL